MRKMILVCLLMLSGIISAENSKSPWFDFVNQNFIQPKKMLTGKIAAYQDGDTVDFLVSDLQIRLRLRLANIDTPEYDQVYGKSATEAIKSFVPWGDEVSILITAIDVYGRFVAFIYLDDVNINLKMVSEGHAWVHPKYCDDSTFFKAQEVAKANKAGLWQNANPVAPWLHRRGITPEDVINCKNLTLNIQSDDSLWPKPGELPKQTTWKYAIVAKSTGYKVLLLPFRRSKFSDKLTNKDAYSGAELAKIFEENGSALLGEGLLDWRKSEFSIYTKRYYYFSRYSKAQNILTAMILKRVAEKLSEQGDEKFSVNVPDANSDDSEKDEWYLQYVLEEL